MSKNTTEFTFSDEIPGTLAEEEVGLCANDILTGSVVAVGVLGACLIGGFAASTVAGMSLVSGALATLASDATSPR